MCPNVLSSTNGMYFLSNKKSKWKLTNPRNVEKMSMVCIIRVVADIRGCGFC